MKTTTILLTVLVLVMAVGCGGNTGYVIKPIPLDERLEETVILREPGFAVSDKIAIIDVDGMILNMRSSSLMGTGENPVSLFVEKIDKAQQDPDVKAVVLRINSPGGGVTASDIMYQRLLRFKAAKHVPVVAVIEDVGASGGYYIACGSDRIMAAPSSLTGSIGVIAQLFSFSGTMDKLGITAHAITSGKFKDMASPFKPMNDQDQALLQKIVDEHYSQFVCVVAKGRPKLTTDRVRELADGRVYTGTQALANGLIDKLGYVEDAMAEAKTMSAAKRVKVVIYHRPVGYRPNEYATVGSAVTPKATVDFNMDLPSMLSLLEPQFLYLWTGSTPRK